MTQTSSKKPSTCRRGASYGKGRECGCRSGRDTADRLGVAGRLRNSRAATARVAETATGIRFLRVDLAAIRGGRAVDQERETAGDVSQLLWPTVSAAACEPVGGHAD